ncbi:chemotaxis protein CheA [Trinickia caryophylli]|uniref:Chemotaxis protein CheA n=1 Tax=Trinickia caryophylli TaxID=28094 RepID=A0A1X7GEM8_TRICW|nr:chemotaxis protein CheA [Trinickia caryophylli]PMS10771.1 chemotaxis protein CheA [Trinickia caryophylli]TRX13851.1 chemotaxis protein CheA [Trinickia caryophylli]WQE15443.1 chemotaxis protein CheA [Trinickia caryophylli]SMF68434.1 two-component system, chemotaxis family, sensor kinase CheA [Trinickia caryophylli]GLU33818.1 chemotaxis protein CheA [Trinickia caryophylli]
MNIDDALQTFIAESRELLALMENGLLSMRDSADPSDEINAVFRAAHTIKGSSGLFGIDGIVAFTHVVESVLDRVRDNEIRIDESLISLLLACGDHIGLLVELTAETGNCADEALLAQAQPLVGALGRYLAASGDGSQPAPDTRTDNGSDAAATPGMQRWLISLQCGEPVLRNGMDPLSIIHYLARLGEVTRIATNVDGVPSLEALDPEACYLAFHIELLSDAGRQAVEGAFEFIREDCTLEITAADGEPADLPKEPAVVVSREPVAMAEDDGRPPAALHAANADTATASATGSARSGAPAREGKAADSHSIRIDADKLDHLIDLVGELITASASTELAARKAQNSELRESAATLTGLIQKVRDSALQLRMVKIGATFNRFRRVVHDVAQELGKRIELVVEGEETELDKTVVEKIGDPLTHLVRNSMDHGIEPAEVRRARGKPEQGTLTLNAFHDSGSIVIQVSDDGGGLDRDRILAKAVERGIVPHDATLSDDEIHALIFEPGFSTAERVTNLSGRGVGMDVVKRNITALRGSIGIDSRAGIGTTISVRLPLTLAIIDGFQVCVGDSIFILPLDAVEECVEFSSSGEHDYTDLRGQVLPFIRLRERFELEGPESARPNIVVVKHAGQRFGLLVDRLLGEAQTVIKPLSKMFGKVRGVSGSTILGSGDVALILDIADLMAMAGPAGTVSGSPALAAC